MAPGLRVLLADSDAVARHALALLLRSKLGVSDIGEASDGAALVAALADCAPGWILLDWSLPGRPPREILQALHHAHPAVRWVILSVNPTHAAEAKTLGGVFIHKALAAEKVLEQLRGLLASPHER
jgi:DNA-binding NarL/FixJ family response regulator